MTVVAGFCDNIITSPEPRWPRRTRLLLVDAFMAEIVKLKKHQGSRNKAVKKPTKPLGSEKREKVRKWPLFVTRTLAMTLVDELLRDTPPSRSPDANAILESGVLAFRREGNGEPRVLLISKIRSKKWGIPKGRAKPHLSLHENAAKEAFEEAGVIGYIAPSSVGMFRAEKATENPLRKQVIEVWVYLLEVTETLLDWPEKRKRTTRWVSCEAAAQQLREPVLTHLCHRLARS
jgi:ADP-ribose pyrophosphatase YjhB (NUDIX family)